MALNEYLWRGSTYQIADEDLPHYPGAVLVNKAPKEKKQVTPANKTRRTPKNK